MNKRSKLIPITSKMQFEDKNGNVYKKPRIVKELTHVNKGKDYSKKAA